MYMSKKTYVKQWSHDKPEDQFSVTVKKGTKKFNNIKPERVSYIVEEVAYWRKFNALHNWFVENIQDGDDNCQESYIPDEKMEELLHTLKSVKTILDEAPKKKAEVQVGWSGGEKLMTEIEIFDIDESILEDYFPTSSGFFFGGTEYDTYYQQNIEVTIKIIEELIEEGGDFFYQASW